jgi:hypothetical protein
MFDDPSDPSFVTSRRASIGLRRRLLPQSLWRFATVIEIKAGHDERRAGEHGFDPAPDRIMIALLSANVEFQLQFSAALDPVPKSGYNRASRMNSLPGEDDRCSLFVSF